VLLEEDAFANPRIRYTLETLLSTLGITFEFTTELTRFETQAPRRSTYLVVGAPQDRRMDGISQETAVVALPRPYVDLSAEIGRGAIPGESIPDPAACEIVSKPTRRGYLVGTATDLIGHCFRLLAREEEYASGERDSHERFNWAHSPLSRSGQSPRPWVSQYAHVLLRCLEEACAGARLPLARKEHWPLGKPLAGCLSHDVDVVRRGKLPRGIAVRDVTRTLKSISRGRLGEATKRAAGIARTARSGQDPYWTFDRISAMEKRFGYRSTYFLMAEKLHPEDGSYDLYAPPIARLLEDLRENGCEVALHGSYATPADAKGLRRQKTLLEEVLGQPVVGHRNHLLRFRAPDSWRAQESIGLSYDSTLGFADHEGFRGGHAFPFHPYDLGEERPLDLIEIPLSVMDASLRKYRRLKGEDAEQALDSCLEETQGVGGLATLLWHNDGFCEADYPGVSGLYERAMTWLHQKRAYVATCQEIDRWWRAREAVRITPLAEGRAGWSLESPLEIEGLVLRVSLLDPRSPVRLMGRAPMTLQREGDDYLLEFGLLPAGSSYEIEYS